MTLINQSGGCTCPQVLLGVGVRFRDTSLWMGTACSGQSWTCRKKQRHKCRHVFLYLIPIPTPQGKSTFYEWRLTPHSWPYNRPLDVSRVTRKWPVQHQQDGESRDSTNGEWHYGRYEQADLLWFSVGLLTNPLQCLKKWWPVCRNKVLGGGRLDYVEALERHMKYVREKERYIFCRM